MRVSSRTIVGIAAMLLVAACTSKPAQEKPLAAVAPDSTPVPAAPPGPKASIGDFGLDLAAGKPQVKPGDDFFAYASGTWYENFEIPPDRSSFGVFNQLDELSKNRVRDIIEIMAIGGGLMAAVRALAAVHALMLVMRMDHGARLFGGGEVPGGRLLMVYPDDGMIV